MLLVLADMDELKNHERYARGAMAILGAGVLAEGARLLAPWPGFVPPASRVVSGFLIVIWALGAVALLLRKRQRFSSLAWATAYAAPVSMLAHGAVTRVGGSPLGLLYIAAALVVAFLLKRTFDRTQQRRPHRHPGGKPPASEIPAPPSAHGAGSS